MPKTIPPMNHPDPPPPPSPWPPRVPVTIPRIPTATTSHLRNTAHTSHRIAPPNLNPPLPTTSSPPLTQPPAAVSYRTALINSIPHPQLQKNPVFSSSAPKSKDPIFPQNRVEPRIVLPPVIVNSIKTTWENTLIIKLTGKSIDSIHLSSSLRSLWKCKNHVRLIGLGRGFYSCKIENVSDLQNIRSNGPWFVLGHYVHIQPWCPNFQPSSAKINFVPTWVILPELPIEYHRTDILQAVGNALGGFIKFDPNGLSNNNARFARLSVHLDHSQPPPTRVWIGSFCQEVRLAEKQIFCFICQSRCNGACGVTNEVKCGPPHAGSGSVPEAPFPTSQESSDKSWTMVPFPGKSKFPFFFPKNVPKTTLFPTPPTHPDHSKIILTTLFPTPPTHPDHSKIILSTPLSLPVKLKLLFDLQYFNPYLYQPTLPLPFPFFIIPLTLTHTTSKEKIFKKNPMPTQNDRPHSPPLLLPIHLPPTTTSVPSKPRSDLSLTLIRSPPPPRGSNKGLLPTPTPHSARGTSKPNYLHVRTPPRLASSTRTCPASHPCQSVPASSTLPVLKPTHFPETQQIHRPSSSSRFNRPLESAPCSPLLPEMVCKPQRPLPPCSRAARSPGVPVGPHSHFASIEDSLTVDLFRERPPSCKLLQYGEDFQNSNPIESTEHLGKLGCPRLGSQRSLIVSDGVKHQGLQHPPRQRIGRGGGRGKSRGSGRAC
ncbi:uncharacterized protein LOC141656305 [Silene latifolia]|uniref:uncharacterized protein LOC141656305 n=1 Tax=Silene latifolia TaxID=37657 RepID=UPI003D786BD8